MRRMVRAHASIQRAGRPAETPLVDQSRCPTCAAVLPAGAAWCSLCFRAVQSDNGQPPLGAPAAVASVPLGAPEERAVLTVGPAPGGPPAVVPSEDAADGESCWPCHACGALTPLAEPACVECGAPFLAFAPTTLQLAGRSVDLRSAGTGQRVTLVIGGAVLVMALLLGLAYLIGQLA